MQSIFAGRDIQALPRRRMEGEKRERERGERERETLLWRRGRQGGSRSNARSIRRKYRRKKRRSKFRRNSGRRRRRRRRIRGRGSPGGDAGISPLPLRLGGGHDGAVLGLVEEGSPPLFHLSRRSQKGGEEER